MGNRFLNIILPVYNPKRIEFAFESLESQTNKDDFEVIIINDCGSNDFEKLLPRYTFNYTVLTTPKNVGQGLARQFGIDNSQSEWITFLDHDDEFTYDCLPIVVKDIKDSECEFLYSTQSIVCNNQNWMSDGMYQIEDSTCVLHGHFYNRKKLEYYNVRFSETIREQEDTYYISLCNNHMLLDKKNFNAKTRIDSDLATYLWYLWDDSQSHTEIEQEDGGKVGYLENSIPQYVKAILDSFIEVTPLYEKDEVFEMTRLCSIVMYVYWFLQAFEYRNPTSWKKSNVQTGKELRDFVINYYNWTLDDFINQIMSMPDLFDVTRQTMSNNVDGSFIPSKTIEQFYRDM